MEIYLILSKPKAWNGGSIVSWQVVALINSIAECGSEFAGAVSQNTEDYNLSDT